MGSLFLHSRASVILKSFLCYSLSYSLILGCSLSVLPQPAYAPDESVLPPPSDPAPATDPFTALREHALKKLEYIRSGKLPPVEMVDRWGLYGTPDPGYTGEETDVYVERVLEPGARGWLWRKRTLEDTDVKVDPNATRGVRVFSESDLQFSISDGSLPGIAQGFIEIIHTDGRGDEQARHLKLIPAHFIAKAGNPDLHANNPVYIYALPHKNPSFVGTDVDGYDDSKIYGFWRFQAEVATLSHGRFPLRMHWVYFKYPNGQIQGIPEEALARMGSSRPAFTVGFGSGVSNQDTLVVGVGSHQFSYNRDLLQLEELLRDDLPLLMLSYIANGKTEGTQKLLTRANEVLEVATQMAMRIDPAQHPQAASFLAVAKTELDGFVHNNLNLRPGAPELHLVQDAFRSVRNFQGSGEAIAGLDHLQTQLQALTQATNADLAKENAATLVTRCLRIWDSIRTGAFVKQLPGYEITGAIIYLGMWASLVGVGVYGVSEFLSTSPVSISVPEILPTGETVTRLVQITKHEGYMRYSWGQFPAFYIDLGKLVVYTGLLYGLCVFASNKLFGKMRGGLAAITGLEGIAELFLKGFTFSIRFIEYVYTFTRRIQRFVTLTPSGKHTSLFPPARGVNPEMEAAKAGFAFRTPKEEVDMLNRFQTLLLAEEHLHNDPHFRNDPSPDAQEAARQARAEIEKLSMAQDAWMDGEAQQQRLTLAHLHVMWALLQKNGVDLDNPAQVLQVLHLMNKPEGFNWEGETFSPANLEKLVATYALLLRYDLRYAQGLGTTPEETQTTLETSDLRDVENRINRALKIQRGWVRQKMRHYSNFFIHDTRGLSRMSHKGMDQVLKSVGYDWIYSLFSYVIARGAVPAAIVGAGAIDAAVMSGMWSPEYGLGAHVYQEMLFQFIYGQLYDVGLFDELGTHVVEKAKYRRKSFFGNLGEAFIKGGHTFSQAGRKNYTSSLQMFWKVFLIRVMSRTIGDFMTATAIYSQTQDLGKAWNGMFDMASWGSYFIYAAPFLSVLNYLMFKTYYNAKNGKLSGRDQTFLFFVYGAVSSIAAIKIYHWVLQQDPAGNQFLKWPFDSYRTMVADIGPMASHAILTLGGIFILGYFWGGLKNLGQSVLSLLSRSRTASAISPPKGTNCLQ